MNDYSKLTNEELVFRIASALYPGRAEMRICEDYYENGWAEVQTLYSCGKWNSQGFTPESLAERMKAKPADFSKLACVRREDEDYWDVMPNWPEDDAAALGLLKYLVENKYCTICIFDETQLIFMDKIRVTWGCQVLSSSELDFTAYNKSLSRAIAEACLSWLEVKNEKR